ncbi:peptidyl-prolyl cis-trans isomerase [Novosphingobium bradum]|uniref:Parvulin-like PPIase n=1 Tax=Novosphingobium bradum TaxID=1737444 RepID=A0ABV7IRP3_9SPHN
MLKTLRSLKNSKLGIVAAIAFLVMIGLSFAAGDISSSQQFGGVAGGDRVATVGNRKLSTAELASAATNALEQLKQENPRLSMKAYVAGGGIENSLTQLIDRAAISVFGASHGVIPSERLVDSEIAKIPAFQGPDGKFSEAAYKALLAQRGLNDKAVRQDLTDGLVARQLLVPGAFGARMPTEVVRRYAALLADRRSGAIALLPAVVFAPSQEPSAAQLAAFYTAHRGAYIRPERRTIRYAVFDESAIRNVPAPTEAEIAARYNANKALYAPSEDRRLSQLVLPSEAEARAAVASGQSLEALAAARSLAVAPLGPIGRAALAAQASPAVADAAFAAQQGKLVGPVRSPLGWMVVRVDAIAARPGKTLDQARAEITADLAAQKKRTALSDFSARIEDEFDKGGSLADVTKELALPIKEAGPLTADGKVYGVANQSAPAELARVVATAFSMEHEGQPQLAEVVPGKTFVVFDVTRIVPSAAAPIAEIRAQVVADYKLEQGNTAARAAAEKLLAALRKGTDLQAALGALGQPGLPPAQKLEISRQELAQQGRGTPPPLALLFSMAQGTAKILAAPQGQGWYVVSLARIVPGSDAAVAPVLADATRELSGVTGREYAESLRVAMREEVGAKRNPAGIAAVRRQLGGEGN